MYARSIQRVQCTVISCAWQHSNEITISPVCKAILYNIKKYYILQYYMLTYNTNRYIMQV